jgi:adenylate kinase
LRGSLKAKIVMREFETPPSKSKVFLFAGPEGSGKSTQAKLLREKLGFTYIGAGDMFRDVAKNDNGELGAAAQEALKGHTYVDPKVATEVFKHRLKKDDVKKTEGVIFDTGLRTLDEVKAFPEILQETLGISNAETVVVYVGAPIEECVRRLQERGREDDTDEGIASRLKEYHKDLSQRISLAKKQWNRFEEISTHNKSKEEVHEELVKRLGL